MVKDKLIHTLHLTTGEQKALMDEMVTLLTSDTIALPPTTIAFLENMVERLSASIIRCADMEIQYEQAMELERGEP
jgi:3'-phosphoadenosine 5'-phosphosulfate sulfotransferase (PAPS reductase)/FAD synthetase